MVFSSEDKILIKNLVLLKGYSSRRLIKELPQKGWNKNGLESRCAGNVKWRTLVFYGPLRRRLTAV